MGAATWVKGAVVSLLAASVGGVASAEDVALVVGNRDYRDAPAVIGADSVVDAADALQAQGVTLVSGKDADLADLRRLVGRFEQMAPSADALLVVLAGRFMQGGTETFFLPVDDDRPGLTGLPGQSLSLSSVLQILSTAPGEAVLVLAEDGRDGERGPFLRDGIGTLDVPQGVTIVRGAPRAVADLVRDVLAVPGAALERPDDSTFETSGFLPDGHSFLDIDDGVTDVDAEALRAARAETERQRTRADRAERAVNEAQVAARQADLLRSRADEKLWQLAQSEDSAAGYRRYVDVFPSGSHADEARRLVADIRADPLRDARLAEDALSLGSSQRRTVQRNLNALGFNTRGIDGIFGEGTRTAIRAWQERSGLSRTGYLDREQLRALTRDAQLREEEAREEERARQEEARRRDDAFWRDLGAGRSEQALRRYLERYPRGQWADVARERLATR